MLRAVLSIFAGLAIAFVGVVATDGVFHAVLTTGSRPAGNNSEAMRDFVAAQPGARLAAVIAGWSLAVLLGTALASRLAQRGAWPGLVVTGMFLLATVANFLMVTYPMSMVVGGLVAVAASGWFGARRFDRAVARVPTRTTVLLNLAMSQQPSSWIEAGPHRSLVPGLTGTCVR